MKKQFTHVCIAILPIIAMLVSTTAFISCSGNNDDENNGGGNNGSSSSKRIVKVDLIDNSDFYESNMFYDAQGRVMKIVMTEDGPGSESLKSETNYHYGDLSILTKTEEEGSWSNGQKYTMSSSHSYSISNGKIVEDVYYHQYDSNEMSKRTTTFSYDNNGYMISMKEVHDNRQYNYTITWKDGNLIEIDHESYSRSYTYSNIPYSKGLPIPFISDLDGWLASMGYFGNLPKLLPSKITDETYDYSITDGLLTKMICSYPEKGEISTETYTFYWE